MADPRGFLKHTEREVTPRRPVPVRIRDWKEVYQDRDLGVVQRQAGRCMDCGIPFCHQGCPLGNLIPEWNDLVLRGRWGEAIDRLHATNNFPEFTGRLCPAPCEDACVLGINQPAVTIKEVEVSIIDNAFDAGLVKPSIPERLTGKTVAIVGSGPAGLAAAQQLTRAGHTVAVYERDDRLGGLLRYGIPDFKLEKHHIDRRIDQMRAEGTRFRTSTEIGIDVGWDELLNRYDAVCLATGALQPRDLVIPGRNLPGVHFAMEYLELANREQAGEGATSISAEGKNVVILGGGDTGADCLGTATRQGAKSVTTLAIGKQPPGERTKEMPWPTAPNLFEVQSAHEEFGDRKFLMSTVEFVADQYGNLSGVKVAETEYRDDGRFPKQGTERIIPADLVLLALGFSGPDTQSAIEQLGISRESSGGFPRANNYQLGEGLFVAGDAGRGQSLIVWAIAEGRAAAAAIDEYLEGSTQLPAPVSPADLPIGVYS